MNADMIIAAKEALAETAMMTGFILIFAVAALICDIIDKKNGKGRWKP